MSESMKERERRTGKMRIVLWLILKPCLRDPSNRPTSLNLSTAPRSLSLEIAQHTTENREILQEIESLLAVEISDLTTPTSDKGQWPRQLGPLNVWFSSANRRYTSTLKMRPIATCKFLLSESKVSTTRNLKEKSWRNSIFRSMSKRKNSLRSQITLTRVRETLEYTVWRLSSTETSTLVMWVIWVLSTSRLTATM